MEKADITPEFATEEIKKTKKLSLVKADKNRSDSGLTRQDIEKAEKSDWRNSKRAEIFGGDKSGRARRNEFTI